ncbi:MAG: glycosyltransferase family 2 protein [Dictyoglomaceae bacterium]|nr:glycosyltransferase family 2 protein [Dictyoglomaceae bacterium]
MNSKKLVSVIIPTYNCEKYIKNCIDSVLAQTYKNIEIIIIDDGSTDNTEKIIENYFKRKVIYLKQENKGPSISRNRGIRFSKGDYITFIDADDYLLPEFIEIGIKEIQKYNNKTWLGFERVYWNGKFNNNLRKLKTSFDFVNLNVNEDSFENMITKAPIITPLIPREAFFIDKIFFNPQIREAEDLELWFRLMLNGWKLVLVRNPNYLYRANRPDSLTSNKLRLYKSMFKIYYNLFKIGKFKLRHFGKGFLNIIIFNINKFLFNLENRNIKKL